jgi:hypothetical protein
MVAMRIKSETHIKATYTDTRSKTTCRYTGHIQPEQHHEELASRNMISLMVCIKTRRTDRLFDGCVVVKPMALEYVDIIQAETAKRVLDRIKDMLKRSY